MPDSPVVLSRRMLCDPVPPGRRFGYEYKVEIAGAVREIFMPCAGDRARSYNGALRFACPSEEAVAIQERLTQESVPQVLASALKAFDDAAHIVERSKFHMPAWKCGHAGILYKIQYPNDNVLTFGLFCCGDLPKHPGLCLIRSFGRTDTSCEYSLTGEKGNLAAVSPETVKMIWEHERGVRAQEKKASRPEKSESPDPASAVVPTMV